MKTEEIKQFRQTLESSWPDWAPNVILVKIWKEELDRTPLEWAEASREILSRWGKDLNIPNFKWGIATHLGLMCPPERQALGELEELMRHRDQSRFQNGSGYEASRPPCSKAVEYFSLRYTPDDNWQRDFRFDYPRFQTEWKSHLVGADLTELLHCEDIRKYQISPLGF